MCRQQRPIGVEIRLACNCRRAGQKSEGKAHTKPPGIRGNLRNLRFPNLGFLRAFAPSREPDRSRLNAGKEELVKSGKVPKDQSERINRGAG